MIVNGKPQRSIWEKEGDDKVIQIIDQRSLPFKFVVEDLTSVDDVAIAIKDMHVRGAPLIGVTAAFGMYLATIEASKADDFEVHLKNSAEKLKQTRPTAVNLFWAINEQLKLINNANSIEDKIQGALENAKKILEDDVESCNKIGEYGLKLIEEISKRKNGEAVNVLTHCNAGWLACVDYGSATSPMYHAHDKGTNIHVWVDETRPRNQGAKLTAWELGEHGIPHTVIVDNAGGLLMQKGMVDIVIVGSDRTTYTGDVANKIGTYLKALSANDNNVPFYAALPSSTIDWETSRGEDIVIEERGEDEVHIVDGFLDGEVKNIRLTPENSKALNFGFDVTPSRLVTGIITERGICEASEKGIKELFSK